LGDKEI